MLVEKPRIGRTDREQEESLNERKKERKQASKRERKN
jgi:hypothetical protein